MIRSSDPARAPAIDPNILGSEEDRQAMLGGLALAQRIFAAEPVAKVAKVVNGPGKQRLPEWIRENCGSYWHPTGTCAIGPCLDNELRVLGLRALRVADASALPVHPRVPTQAACMAVGWRCAELLLLAHQES
mmetsp:Transcript_133608/g.427233  ORF Transcript_133608/g.427233 Transcript_133608/m.427233 type:complete len:133 (+) Transcript_133608:1175-1573(+)